MGFLDSSQNRVLLLDGPIEAGIHQQSPQAEQGLPALYNATRPMDILDAHHAYMHAGADILRANTFGANSMRLAPLGLQSRMEELVQSGVALCKEAITGQPRTAYAAASIGPTGALYHASYETPTQMYNAFFMQSKAAAAAGADILCIEAMQDLSEARLALLAARSAASLPILIGFAMEQGGRTLAGNPPEVLAHCCAKLGAHMVGLHSRYGPAMLHDGYSRLAGASVIPTFIMPGACKEAGGEALPPATLAAAMKPFLDGGAAIIGAHACATPAHTEAMRELLDGYPSEARAAAFPGEYICSPGARLPLNALEPYTLLALQGMQEAEALQKIQELVLSETVLHIDFGNWGGEETGRLLFQALPYIFKTPLAFHFHSAKQANTALLEYPGIAAVYAHSDTYRVMKAAARYGAEVIL